jgi:hypothetical protein
VLAADFAVELADAELLVQLDNDGLFVVAEEAGEGRGQGFTLREKKTDGLERVCAVGGSYSNCLRNVPSLGLAACAMTSCVFPGGGSVSFFFLS